LCTTKGERQIGGRRLGSKKETFLNDWAKRSQARGFSILRQAQSKLKLEQHTYIGGVVLPIRF